MCIQLDLFSGRSLQESVDFLAENEFREMAQRQGIYEEVVSYDPCPKCRYFGLCDSDDCAMHGFGLDSEDLFKIRIYE